MSMVIKINWRQVAILFALGMVGVFSALPMIPAFISASGQEPPLPMFVIQMLSTLQSAVILFALVILGAYLAPKVNLGAPILDAWLHKSWGDVDIKQKLFAGVIGGVLGGILIIGFYLLFLPHLPEDFVVNAEEFSPPLYTKVLYGGITEELLIRWGLMSFFVWVLYRLTQSQTSKVMPINYVLGIVISSVVFGVGHLPAANMLSPVMTVSLVIYIIIGNSIFGLIAGYLYWRKGLESAILSHVLAHLVMAFSI